MIIWRGWGILTLFILFPALFGSIIFTNRLAAGSERSLLVDLIPPIAMLIAAGINYGIARRLSHPTSKNSLMFIPMEYWSALTALLSIAFIFALLSFRLFS